NMADSPQPRPTGGPPTSLRNWLSLSGGLIAVSSFFAFLLLFGIDLFAHHTNPYMGILAYVVAPGFLVVGTVLVVIGVIRERRRRRKGGPPRLTIDLSRSHDRKALGGFIAGAIIFLLVTALGSYHTYQYTESLQFCGQACHVPMKPEFTAYL